MKNINQLFMNFSKFTNENKFIFGVAMLIFNLGSKYVILDLSKSQETFMKTTIMRRIILFCLFFVATRDLIVSLILTSIFIIFALGIFDERSSMSIIPPSLYDDVVTDEEYNLAKSIISKYETKK